MVLTYSWPLSLILRLNHFYFLRIYNQNVFIQLRFSWISLFCIRLQESKLERATKTYNLGCCTIINTPWKWLYFAERPILLLSIIFPMYFTLSLTISQHNLSCFLGQNVVNPGGIVSSRRHLLDIRVSALSFVSAIMMSEPCDLPTQT